MIVLDAVLLQGVVERTLVLVIVAIFHQLALLEATRLVAQVASVERSLNMLLQRKTTTGHLGPMVDVHGLFVLGLWSCNLLGSEELADARKALA